MIFVFNGDTEHIRGVLEPLWSFGSGYKTFYLEMEDGTKKFALSSPWCREIMCNRTYRSASRLLASLGFEDVTVDIHGIRKDPGNKTYQPRFGRTKIGSRVETADDAVMLFNHAICMCLHEIFGTGDHDEALRTYDNLFRGFAASANVRNSFLVNYRVIGNVGIYLNDEGVTYNLGPDRDQGKVTGSFTNVPIQWLTSKSVVSFMAYLVRAWGYMYSTRYAPYIVGCHKAKSMNLSHDLATTSNNLGRGLPTAMDKRAARLLSVVYALLAHALEPSRYCHTTFWSFTAMLVSGLLASLDDDEPGTRVVREALERDGGVDGFNSLMHQLLRNHDSSNLSNIVYTFYEEVPKYGPSRYTEPYSID